MMDNEKAAESMLNDDWVKNRLSPDERPRGGMRSTPARYRLCEECHGTRGSHWHGRAGVCGLGTGERVC